MKTFYSGDIWLVFWHCGTNGVQVYKFPREALNEKKQKDLYLAHGNYLFDGVNTDVNPETEKAISNVNSWIDDEANFEFLIYDETSEAISSICFSHIRGKSIRLIVSGSFPES